MKKSIPYLLIIASFFLSVLCFSQAGSLDPTFGNGGKTTTNFFERFVNTGAAQAVAVQPDGKIVVVKGSIIFRYNQDGTLDDGFNKDGFVFSYSFSASCVAIQSDGKIVVAGAGTVLQTTITLVRRYNADGSLDHSFVDRLNFPVNSGVSYRANSIAIQDDGKIVVAGIMRVGLFQGFSDFLVVRYNVDGSLDNSFDGDGIVTTDVGSSHDVANSVAIQDDGKIVAAGNAMARYNTDGSLDNSFDGDGKLNTVISSINDKANAIAIQTDGKIVLAGTSYTGTEFVFAAARYNVDGILDNSFDGDGILTTSIGASSFANSIAIQADNKIVVAGASTNGIKSFFATARYNTDGTLDTGFDGDGKLTTVFSTTDDNTISDDNANSVALQPDGKIVVAGGSYDAITLSVMALGRYNTDGSLDNSFDGDGKLIKSIGYSVELANAVAVQPDGKIVAAGYTYIGGSLDVFAIARYNTNGSLDIGFGNDGKVTTDIGSVNSKANAVAIQGDGKIVVAGTSFNGTKNVFALARYNTDGSLDKSFDGDGKLTTVFSDGDLDSPTSVVIQGDGKILVAGGSANQFAMARYNADGSLDNRFDEDGKLTTRIGISAFASSIAIQADNKIVLVGGSSGGALNNGFTLARYNTDGSLDNSFDADGLLNTAIGSTSFASSVAIQPDGKIVVGGGSNNGSSNEFALARYNSDGSLDNSFDSDGILTMDVGISAVVHSIALQSDGKIVLAGNSIPETQGKSALARYNTDGSLDLSFGTQGKVVTDDLQDAPEFGNSMKIFGNRIYIAGYTFTETERDFLVAAYLLQSEVQITCPSDKTVQAEPGQCVAVANDIDPVIIPAGNNAIVSYTLSGATSRNGTGSASGQSFNKGVTTVTYFIGGEREKTCSFTVTVKPSPEICNNDKDDDCDGLIDEDCHKLPKIYITNTVIREGNNGTRHAIFELRISKPTDKPITVDYHTADRTARAPGDYEQKSGTIIFQPTTGTRKILIKVNGDRVHEANERFSVVLSDAVNGVIRDERAVCTIIDDDPVPAINIHDVVTKENCGQVLVRVSLNEPSEQVITVQYYTKNGSAKAPEDYTPVSDGTLVFEPGEIAKDISIVINQDVQREPAEKFYVLLRQAENAELKSKEAEVQIINTDPENRLMSKGAPVAQSATDENRMIVSPNPANQSVNLRLLNKGVNGKIVVELMDQNGRVVKRWLKSYDSDGQSMNLPVADIPGGVYLVVIKDGKGKRLQQQVVVQH